MKPIESRLPSVTARSRIRQNAGSAGFAALCLIYFGYFFWIMPTVTNLQSFGDALCQYTMRIGGMAFAFVALASLAGRAEALFADAIVSVLTGVGLILSALLMMAGSGAAQFNLILYCVFGVLFVSAGIRNGRDFFELRGDPRVADPYPPPTSRPTPSSCSVVQGEPKMVQSGRGDDSVKSDSEGSPPAAPDLRSAGFLAAFADRKPPSQ